MSNNKYQEISGPNSATYKEKGSKFIAYAYPVHTLKEIKEKLDEVKKTEYAARHHCYAYVLHPDKSVQKSNDDREPASTAGKPILGQIISNDLTNILIVVARYFGGIKLGVSGLIRSYRTVASNVILKAQIVEKTEKKQFVLKFKYEQIHNVMRILKVFNLEILHTDFQAECKLIFAVPKDKAKIIIEKIKKNYKLQINISEEIF